MGLLGMHADVAFTVEDKWQFPLVGMGLYTAFGSYDTVVTSYDGSIVELRPWSTLRAEILLPGIGYRWKHRRNQIGVALRTGAGFLKMEGTAAAGVASEDIDLSAGTFLLSLELEGPRRTRDDRGRSIYEPYRLELRDRDLAAYDTLEERVRLLDWAMTLPVALPAGNQTIRGTLRAYGTSRPIAIDLTARSGPERHSLPSELAIWAAINREPID